MELVSSVIRVLGFDDRLVLSHSSWNNNNNNNTDNAAASHTVRAEIFGSGEFGISDQGIGDVYNLHHYDLHPFKVIKGPEEPFTYD